MLIHRKLREGCSLVLLVRERLFGTVQTEKGKNVIST